MTLYSGELFKIGVLHEAIIHSCIKEVSVAITPHTPSHSLLIRTVIGASSW